MLFDHLRDIVGQIGPIGSRKIFACKLFGWRKIIEFAATQMWGLSVQSINGSSKKELLATADIAIKAFPN